MACQKKICIILALFAKKLSASLFRRVQIQKKENTNVKIHKC